MFISIGPLGLPVHSPDVKNTLPTNSALQPNSEPACETSQISSPVADVADVTKAQDLKSNSISFSFVYLINLTLS
jgi:hypothetical protein